MEVKTVHTFTSKSLFFNMLYPIVLFVVFFFHLQNVYGEEISCFKFGKEWKVRYECSGQSNIRTSSSL